MLIKKVHWTQEYIEHLEINISSRFVEVNEIKIVALQQLHYVEDGTSCSLWGGLAPCVQIIELDNGPSKQNLMRVTHTSSCATYTVFFTAFKVY